MSHSPADPESSSYDLVIHRAHVFDGREAHAQPHDIAIRGGTIAAVSRDPLRGRIDVDAAGGWVMPGLIDTHVHIYDVAAVSDPDSLRTFEDEALPGLLDLFLQHGVTTVKSVGDPTEAILQARDDVAAGTLRGPRLLATGCGVTARGGHPATTVFARNLWARAQFTAEIDSLQQMRDVIHRLADQNVDAIKLLSEGACACHDAPPYLWRSPAFPGAVELVRLSPQLLAAGIQTAHDRGLRVTVHTMQQDAAREAIDAGADGLEHGITVEPITDGALIEKMSERNVTYVPTLWAHDGSHPDLRANLMKVVDAGVPVALGSDTFTGLGTFGANSVAEAELMVAAGMTPGQSLKAGTSSAARHCRRSDIGTIATGKRADLIVLAADPTENIGNLRTLRMTILGGEIVVDRN